MGVDATEIYFSHPKNHKLTSEDIKSMSSTVHLISDVRASKMIVSDTNPKIVLAGSGMITGGRVLHYLEAFIGQKRNTLLIVGFQAEGTRGRALLSGDSEIKFFGKYHKINAEIFCIGTELEKFVLNRPQFWEQLIRTIRKVYKGKLTYAANWDEYKKLTFWNQLDFIGVDAYFPLSEKETPTVTDFEKGWKPHKIEIQQLQKKFQKPILFTEYGYRSVHFNGKQPWKVDDIEGNINFQAQVNGLQAIHNQFWKEDWFAGGFVWKWFHAHEKSGGKNNNRFTPQNKPAEQLLKKLHSN